MQDIQDNAGSIGADHCPFLGLREDPQTAIGFPSGWNFCHRARPAQSITLAHQTAFCQAPAHTGCPVLQSTRPRPLPPDVRNRQFMQARRGRRLHARKRWLLLALLLLGVPAVWFAGAHWPASAGTSGAAQPASAVLTPSALPGGTPASPGPLLPVSSSCGYGLDEPIGDRYRFIIHAATDGESLDRYAAQYGTSVDAILAVNAQLPLPLRAGRVLVIPDGFADVAGLPSFQPYYAPGLELSLDGLAGLLHADASLLKQYNALGDCASFSGWLLLPVTSA